MGEHADDGDREDERSESSERASGEAASREDEEPAPASADDSPADDSPADDASDPPASEESTEDDEAETADDGATDDEAETNDETSEPVQDSGADADDATSADGADAGTTTDGEDASADDEDPVATGDDGATDDEVETEGSAGSGPEIDSDSATDKSVSHGNREETPSAEEWLEDNPGAADGDPDETDADEDSGETDVDEDSPETDGAHMRGAADAPGEEGESDTTDADAAGTDSPAAMQAPGRDAPTNTATASPAGGASATGGGASAGFPDFGGDMAPDDREQPLTEHMEEMTYRFLAVALVMGGVAAVALLWSDDMINFLWYSFLGPADGTCPGAACPLEWRPHVYHPLSLLLARLKVAALIGFIVGLPVAVYQTYRFMRPGLYPHERRYYLAAVPTSLVLAITGLTFAYYVVLPSLFIYFSAYSTQAAELAFALSDTFNLMVMMLGFFALVFQIPLLVMLAIMMGVTTRRWLEDRRLYFWMGFAGVAFVFSPDPTGMAPLIVALTMITLFEGTLLLLRWTERSVALFSAKSLEARRPYAWALAALTGYILSSVPVPTGYFDSLPPVVVETLTEWGVLALTPALIAGTIILAFELLGTIARRISAARDVRSGLRVRLAFIRLRAPVWLVAIVVGYAGSPDPVILETFDRVAYDPEIAIGVAAGLIVAYELLRWILTYVRPE